MIKVLLDENLPVKLKFRFDEDFEVSTVYDMGWNAKKNGELLDLINNGEFHYFITSDQNIEYQQNITFLKFSLIILIAPDNRYETLVKLISSVKEAIKSPSKLQLIHIGIQ